MNIALLGYGKMGKAIEALALERQHQVPLKIDCPVENLSLEGIDVAIDFSTPEAAFNNIRTALKQGVPVVSGTTGWLEHYPEVVDFCLKQKGSFIYASNFSLGVNLFFEINQRVAQLMNGFNYKVTIEETHHIHKLDAPSGTAISLAEQILPYAPYTQWKMEDKPGDGLPITSHRIDEVPGTHVVNYSSSIDEIRLTHTALSRKGFALGAVLAAEYIADKKGVFQMKDVLGI
jgi:4-hydroxy-tetrahydrodipicolinate reductase